ncbi:hypothetical protein [Bradyrhizobium archetypum]|uniref:hypothetical protein n=1 Tax=Bradyrhizobium archetypum TaxID=2721160 RepID=UPI001F47FB72|nr:hypothetical protein [Bradyrhizobium archetypum]
MSRKWTSLTLILFLGSGGTLQAEPLDSPGVVYIDGKPCNRACQSYMDWSYRMLSARRHEEGETSVAVPAEAETDRVEPVARPRVARHAAPVSRTAPHAGKAASNGRTTGNKAPNSKKIAAANAAPQTPMKEIPAVAAALPPPSEIGKTASASSDDQDNLVALVLARPEINSLSDLNNKNIAITEKQSASSGRVSAALMAAGAAEVQFSEVKTSAIDRLMSGEVAAAVLLASREAADLFPELAGFRTFRVPLTQKARL